MTLSSSLSDLASLVARSRADLSPFGPLLFAFLAFAWVVYLFETWLDVRQHRLFATERKPKELTYVTQEEFTKAQAYGQAKSQFGFVTSLWGNTKLTLLLWIGYYPILWNLSVTLTDQFGFESPFIVTSVFYILDAALELALSLPFAAWSTFVIEARFGFNKQTPTLFLTDNLKGLLLNAIIAPPLICLFVYVIEVGGEYFYLYVAGLVFVVQLVAVPFYSNLIQPLFNKVDRLPEGSLRTSIEQLAASIEFPLTGLYVIDGSKRSSHSNAYFFGLWRWKKIVLFDTLIRQCTERQVVSVLAHELGHWKLNHTVKNLILNQVQVGVMFYCFSFVLTHAQLYSDFGFRTRATYIGLLLFGFLYSPVQHVTSFLMNVLSRRFEFEADKFAVDLGYQTELAEALITLQKENKGTMIPDPAYSAYHHSHPPMLQRLKAIQEAGEQRGKKGQ